MSLELSWRRKAGMPMKPGGRACPVLKLESWLVGVDPGPWVPRDPGRQPSSLRDQRTPGSSRLACGSFSPGLSSVSVCRRVRKWLSVGAGG